MRKPSAETELRRLKRAMRDMTADRNRERADAVFQRRRAENAEQEAADWKRRFDALLARDAAFGHQAKSGG